MGGVQKHAKQRNRCVQLVALLSASEVLIVSKPGRGKKSEKDESSSVFAYQMDALMYFEGATVKWQNPHYRSINPLIKKADVRNNSRPSNRHAPQIRSAGSARNSSLKSKNYKAPSPARQSFTSLPSHFGQGAPLVVSVSVARVQPGTSKGITAFQPYKENILYVEAQFSICSPYVRTANIRRPTARMGYDKSELTPNEALQLSTKQERESTIARLRDGDANLQPAIRTSSGCLECQKTGTRTGGGPTSYPATPIKKSERANRSKNGTHAPRPPPILANRLVAYQYGNDADRDLLINGDGQASHLCSSAQCIEPRHIIVESKAANEARKRCPLRHEKVYIRRKSGKRSKPNDFCSCRPLCIRKTENIVFSSDEE